MPSSPNVYVFDNLIGTGIVDEVWMNVLNQPIWKFGWRGDKKDASFRFWNTNFLANKEQSTNIPQEVYDRFCVKYPEIVRLWSLIRSTIVKELYVPLDLHRVYANAYTFGTGGSMHRDDGIWTCLYYGTREWDPKWRGETLFFDDNKHLVDACEYIPGRFVIFPASMFHQAGDVSKNCNSLRTIIAFKCR